jgi:hypothetical protein
MHDIRSSFVAGEGLRKASPVAHKAAKPKEEVLTGSLTAISIPRSESRISNHRTEDRLPNLVDAACLVFRRERLDVEVVNVSSMGTMIRSDVDAIIGEAVEIQFADCNRVRAAVRWVKDGKIGLEFEERTEIIASARTQERIARPHLELVPTAESTGDAKKDRALALRAARQGLVWNGTLYWTFEALNVRVRNISPEGAMIDCDRNVPAGAQVRLNLAEAGTLEAEVRWSNGGQVGLKFKEKFDLRQLARAKPAGFVATATTLHEDEKKKASRSIAALWNRAVYGKTGRG